MSNRSFDIVEIPKGAEATPESIGQAITETLTRLGEKIEASGRKPVWDTVAISTDLHVDMALDAAGEVRSIHRSAGVIEVRTVDPREASL